MKGDRCWKPFVRRARKNTDEQPLLKVEQEGYFFPTSPQKRLDAFPPPTITPTIKKQRTASYCHPKGAKQESLDKLREK